ncbi:hypothetical protein [Candidatus Poriferisodalis sp.]|uniref:hypothetical protein n=1 Tax=Candidatus Poriferisodalis sp. TaxID=3101277 RepID=UPI003B02AD1C
MPEVAATVPATPDHYSEIDVSDWPNAGDETLGTKPKKWLRDPESGERWLMKYVTNNRNAAGTEYPKGDDWSERVANGVALRLGIPAAHTQLAVQRDGGSKYFGIISREVLAPHDSRGRKREELIAGNELLPHPLTGRSRTGYTLAAVKVALVGVDPAIAAPEGLTAWDVFAGYLVLDALVGNTDRHQENWAVIAGTDSLRLAPTFDHASSLGFLLSDDARFQRLKTSDSGFTPEAYADRATSPFESRPHPIALASEALRMCESHVRDTWMSGCEDADYLVEPVSLVPADRMSEPARQFAERVMRRNCDRLLQESH